MVAVRSSVPEHSAAATKPSRPVKANAAQVRAAAAAGASRAKAATANEPVFAGAMTTDVERQVGAASALSYIDIYRASPLERIAMSRRGIPALQAKRLFSELAIGQATGLKALNLSAATINKKAKQSAPLSTEESERVIGFMKLVGQLEAMIQESGDPAGFDARAWMARWLTEPLPAFGGARPADFMDTMEGQGLVSSALARIQSGAYA